jgi:hypothetical protein
MKGGFRNNIASKAFDPKLTRYFLQYARRAPARISFKNQQQLVHE